MTAFKGSPTESNAEGVEMVLVGLAAFASVDAKTIIAADGVRALVNSIEWISKQTNIPRKNDLLVAAFQAMNELGQDPTISTQLYDALESCDGLSGLVSSIKSNAKVGVVARAGCLVLGSLASSESAQPTLISKGAVQAISSAMVKHIDDVDTISAGISACMEFASSDFGANSVFKSGGVRAIVKLLNSKLVKQEEYRVPTLTALRLLHRGAVSSTNAREKIQDGDGVDACINAMQKRPGDDEVADAAIACATELLTNEDVTRVVSDLKELLALPAAKLEKPKNLHKLAQILGLVGIIAAAEKFAPLFEQQGGVEALVLALKTIYSMPESEARELTMNSAIAALGQMSDMQKLHNTLRLFQLSWITLINHVTPVAFSVSSAWPATNKLQLRC